MRQRLVGASGLAVSRLGLGTLTWGRETQLDDARPLLRAFVAAGGNLVDTAAGYASGDAERMLGRMLRAGDVAREEVVVATKAGFGIRDGERRVEVRMTLTAPGCGMGDILVDDVRAKIEAIPTIAEAEVELVFDPPWNQSMMSDVAKLETGML